jgi:FkbM family methyltransferase
LGEMQFNKRTKAPYSPSKVLWANEGICNRLMPFQVSTAHEKCFQMNVLAEALQILTDATSMGVRFLGRHFAGLHRGSTYVVRVKEFGVFHVRRGAGHTDIKVLRQVFKDRQLRIWSPAFSERIQHRYSEIIASGKTPVIIDAGAHIGASARWFKVKYPQAHILAIEPDPDNCEVLRKNGQEIETVHAAIGSVAGRAQIINDGWGAWATRTKRSEDGVRILTMQEAIQMVPNGTLFQVKIDIEGFEEDLFAQNLDWLDQSFVVYVEPHDWMLPDRYSSKNFQKAFAKRDFKMLLNGEHLIYVRC